MATIWLRYDMLCDVCYLTNAFEGALHVVQASGAS